MTVATQVTKLCQLLGLRSSLGGASLAVAFITIVGVWFYVLVALVCREFYEGCGEGLDLCQHCVELGAIRLCVGCMVIVGHCRTCYLCNEVTDFVATVHELVHRLVLV